MRVEKHNELTGKLVCYIDWKFETNLEFFLGRLLKIVCTWGRSWRDVGLWGMIIFELLWRILPERASREYQNLAPFFFNEKLICQHMEFHSQYKKNLEEKLILSNVKSNDLSRMVCHLMLPGSPFPRGNCRNYRASPLTLWTLNVLQT